MSNNIISFPFSRIYGGSGASKALPQRKGGSFALGMALREVDNYSPPLAEPQHYGLIYQAEAQNFVADMHFKIVAEEQPDNVAQLKFLNFTHSLLDATKDYIRIKAVELGQPLLDVASYDIELAIGKVADSIAELSRKVKAGA